MTGDLVRGDPALGDVVLDDPVGESLRGRHAHLAWRRGRALRYAPEVATFVAVPVAASADDWGDLAALLGPGGFADMFCSPTTPPADWEPVFAMDGLQMIGAPDTALPAAEDPDVIELGIGDVVDMVALADVARPGPFWPRTCEMGTYLGIRERGRLVAMAGERLRPPGWTEISAVCTTPAVRGRGFASRLVQALTRRILARGERPFIHVAADNTRAIDLYLRLGFRVRKSVRFHGSRIPCGEAPDVASPRASP